MINSNIWFRKAEKGYQKIALIKNVGWVDASWQLGNIYEHGYGVMVDLPKAKEYYRQACLFPFKPACKKYDQLVTVH